MRRGACGGVGGRGRGSDRRGEGGSLEEVGVGGSGMLVKGREGGRGLRHACQGVSAVLFQG